MKYVEEMMVEKKKTLELLTWEKLSNKHMNDLIDDKHDRSTLEEIMEPIIEENASNVKPKK